jgi:hypothetical protein
MVWSCARWKMMINDRTVKDKANSKREPNAPLLNKLPLILESIPTRFPYAMRPILLYITVHLSECFQFPHPILLTYVSLTFTQY